MAHQDPLIEEIAQEMFVDYRLAQGYRDPEKVRDSWVTGKAFVTPQAKSSWYRRAGVALKVILDKGRLL